MILGKEQLVCICKTVPGEVHMPLKTQHPIDKEEKKHGEMSEQEQIPPPNFSLASCSHMTILSCKGMAQNG